MSTDDPIVSVIVPAFQAERTIQRSLTSLITQTQPRWNAVVINDGSFDQTAQAARAVDDARVSVVSIDRSGVSAARNIGFARSNAPFVCFLDADDTLDETYFESMIPAAQDSPLGAACGFRYIDTNGKAIHEVPAPSRDMLELDELLRLDPPAIMSILHRRDILMRSAMDDGVFDRGMSAFEDWDMLRRIGELRLGCFADVPQTLASYHCTPNSLSQDVVRTLRTGISLLRQHGDRCQGLPKRIREYRLRNLGACIVAGQDSQARSIRAVLGSLVPEDAESILRAIEWNAMRRWGLGEGDLAAHRSEAIELSRRVLAGSAVQRRVLDGLDDWAVDIWGTVLRRAEQSAGSQGRIVVFGAGRNGLRATARANDLGIECVVTDDDPGRRCPGFENISPEDVGAADVVVMTPDRCGDAMERLRERGVTRFVTRQDERLADSGS